MGPLAHGQGVVESIPHRLTSYSAQPPTHHSTPLDQNNRPALPLCEAQARRQDQNGRLGVSTALFDGWCITTLTITTTTTIIPQDSPL